MREFAPEKDGEAPRNLSYDLKGLWKVFRRQDFLIPPVVHWCWLAPGLARWLSCSFLNPLRPPPTLPTPSVMSAADPSPKNETLLASVLKPLLEDFQYWFQRSLQMLEQESIHFFYRQSSNNL